MNEPGIPFIVLAAIFLLVVIALCLFGVRRFQLRRALGTVDASLCIGGNRWQMGVCRYQESDLEWFRLLSLSPIPRRKMVRSSIELVGRRKPTEAELTRVPPGVVIVTLSYKGEEVLLAMKFGAYAGLSSWLEAGPVVGIGTWR
ncbi:MULTISPECIES: DUF2550 domain-containing protein [unclassified Arthrobacter]|uniref:DUF2550 domain-containing protein n=1 Tax=unclassified Arthrobacter TaxID=235627 RepID=UPI00159E4E51|nr:MULTISPECIES: DUF2550 domain-containing protein [unclassified Arthrobacter]MCQ9163289.1 DUF2550 domain-containing protein [Arthrobacter sp. STN4]NVM98863.1 DUF2550 domain-containing protein [Arthrobacter sp. SDTb3-6]